MTTASRSDSSTASIVPSRRLPMTTSSTSGCVASARARKDPIRPLPRTPILTGPRPSRAPARDPRGLDPRREEVLPELVVVCPAALRDEPPQERELGWRLGEREGIERDAPRPERLQGGFGGLRRLP